MRAARWVGVVVALLGTALPLAVGDAGLAGRLKESAGEFVEARGRLAADLERSGIALPPALEAAVKELADRAGKASAALAERPDPDVMAKAREVWESVGSARSLLRRIRHEHAEAAEHGGARQHAELWAKVLDVAARAIRSRMAQRGVDAIRLEAELDVMRLTLEHEREKRELAEEFAEMLEFAAEHRGDPRVAAVVAELRARFAALQKTHELRYQAERSEIQIEAQRHILEATKEEHERVRRAAERELEELEDDTKRLMDRGERLIDAIEDAREDEDEDEDEDAGERRGNAEL